MAVGMDRAVPLDEVDDFKVADGNRDVSGADGRRIGEVDERLRQSFDRDDGSSAATVEPAFHERRGYGQAWFFGRRRTDDGSDAGVGRNSL